MGKVHDYLMTLIEYAEPDANGLNYCIDGDYFSVPGPDDILYDSERRRVHGAVGAVFNKNGYVKVYHNYSDYKSARMMILGR